MPLPPLPLVDDHLFVDNSFIENWINCPRKTEYSILHGRVYADSAPALNYGGAIHAAQSHRYIHAPEFVLPHIEAQQLDILYEWFEKSPNPVDSHRNLELAQKTIIAYNEKWKLEEFKVMEYTDHNGIVKPAVELPFVFHLFDTQFQGRIIRIMFCGRIDLVVWIDGQIYIFDHKTTSMYGEGFWKDKQISPQLIGYFTAVRRLFGNMCAGYGVNGIFVPNPKQRKDMQMESKDFQRMRWPIQEGAEEEWELNTTSLIREFLWHYEQEYLPQKKTWCVHKYGTCDYFDICALPKDSREVMLHSGYYVDNDWSPLTDFHKIVKEGKV